MPRSRSTAIQSERTRRRAPRAFTSPASWIAPPNSSYFSVKVVLPASGCRNDRKGAPARNLVGQGAHQSAIAVARVRAVARKRSRCAGTGVDMMGARRFANCYRAAGNSQEIHLRQRSARVVYVKFSKLVTMSGQANEPAGCLADDPPARRGGRHRGGYRLPHVPRRRDHRLPRQWRCTRARPGKWRPTRARARPSSTTARRSGSRKTRWRGSGCER